MKTFKIQIPANEIFIHELMVTISNARRMQARNMFKDENDPNFEEEDCLYGWINYKSYGILHYELDKSLMKIERKKERKKRTTTVETNMKTSNIIKPTIL